MSVIMLIVIRIIVIRIIVIRIIVIRMIVIKFRCDVGTDGWCGERRKDSLTGAVQRCAERTRWLLSLISYQLSLM